MKYLRLKKITKLSQKYLNKVYNIFEFKLFGNFLLILVKVKQVHKPANRGVRIDNRKVVHQVIGPNSLSVFFIV